MKGTDHTDTSMEVQLDSQVAKFDFKQLKAGGSSPMSDIVCDFGVVYVTAITRDSCSGCEEQKPLFRELARKVKKEHAGMSKFSDIHITYREEDGRESEGAKTALRHGSYPTYLVHVNSRFGPLEHYRAAYPSMEELEKHIVDAFELAEFYQKDASADHSRT